MIIPPHRTMSADLLAEFGQPEPCTDDNKKKVVSALNVTLLLDNEVFVPNVSDAFSHVSLADKTEDRPENIWHRDGSGAEVLFDASTDQNGSDEDFGDFEDAEQELVQGQPVELIHDAASEETSSASVVRLQNLVDLEGYTDPPHSSKSSEGQDHEGEWGEFSAAVLSEEPRQIGTEAPRGASNPGQAAPVDSIADKEEWDPFEDGPATTVTEHTYSARPPMFRRIEGTATSPMSQPQDLSSAERAPAVPPKDESRPANIPPPAILLQMLPKLFENLADSSSADGYMQSCNAVLQAYTVSSHIIAGRASRWKRDNILSQSTRIGPAAASRKGGGMKLASIDKTESLKEQREVADVVQTWGRHAHFFNSIVQNAGIRRPLMTLSEHLKPRPAKGTDVLISQYVCALCGLKRNERVPGTDINVDDSFGEYWIEHWGHRDCKDFWHRNQALLPQR
jgi:hypothetical protein